MRFAAAPIHSKRRRSGRGWKRGGTDMSFYQRLLGSVLMPAYDRVRSRRYVERSRFLEASQWWRPEQIVEFQWTEVKALLKHAFDSVPYYQQKYRAAGASFEDIRSWADFQRLPSLSREEIQQNREALCST